MKVTMKPSSGYSREEAHGGSGSRILILSDNEMKNVQGMTYGYLPSGHKYAWHNHSNMNEVMYVLKGTGVVRDEDGIYSYSVGDCFVFPAEVFHEIENTSNEEDEFVFVRVYE